MCLLVLIKYEIFVTGMFFALFLTARFATETSLPFRRTLKIANCSKVLKIIVLGGKTFRVVMSHGKL